MPALSQVARSLGTMALALAGGALLSCYVLPEQPILGYEFDDIACSDGIDNDADLLVDCEDPDCIASSTLCGEIVPDPPVEEDEPNGIGRDAVASCRDRIDNNGNGQFDCGEQGCRDIPETCCVLENTDDTCSDGIDNDGNGFADCEDFGCRRGIFVTVCVENTPALCDDGKDNDGDGRRDCDDRDCFGVGRCPVLTEDTPEACGDGKDNDRDGRVDCRDRDCHGIGECPVPDPEDSIETCSDGIDNDDNGFTDCADFACQDIPGLCELEDSVETCSDGIDNDGNGFVDCADFSCSDADDVLVRQLCQESASGSTAGPGGQLVVISADESCSNGIDEDGDGFIDCDDWDCRHNPAVSVCEDTPLLCR